MIVSDWKVTLNAVTAIPHSIQINIIVHENFDAGFRQSMTTAINVIDARIK